MIQINFMEKIGTLQFDTLEEEQEVIRLLNKAHKKAGWTSLPRMEFIEFYAEKERSDELGIVQSAENKIQE